MNELFIQELILILLKEIKFSYQLTKSVFIHYASWIDFQLQQ